MATGSSTQRGPRPAKSANCIAPASPSPDSSSDNASDNSDLFQWTTSGVERHLARSDSSPSGSRPPGAPHSGALTASRKRKLLEQFLLPETVPGAVPGPAPPGNGNTISLSDMRTMGLVGQSRPSASIQPTSGPSVGASAVSAAAAAAAAVAAAASTRGSIAPAGAQMSFSSAYVPSFSFYQSRSFGPPSCSGGGSTESLCSSTADSACGHAPDLPDDGNLATPAPPVDVSILLSVHFELVSSPGTLSAASGHTNDDRFVRARLTSQWFGRCSTSIFSRTASSSRREPRPFLIARRECRRLGHARHEPAHQQISCLIHFAIEIERSLATRPVFCKEIVVI